MHRLRNRLTYANVIATIALFIALGGASYAATQLPKNSVGSKQLKRNAVNGAKVKPGSLPASALKAGAIPAIPAPPNLSGLLGSTVVVNKTIAAPLAKDDFATGKVLCPPGLQAIAGGVVSSNVLTGKVSASGPLVNGQDPQLQPDGQSGPATGWFGAVTTQGGASGSEQIKIQVICASVR